jgi:hypothetical protein
LVFAGDFGMAILVNGASIIILDRVFERHEPIARIPYSRFDTGIISPSMNDDSLRLILLKLSEHVLAIAEEQLKIRASVSVLKLAVMHLKGVPETHLQEFLDSLAETETRLTQPLLHDEAIQQIRAIVKRLESGHDPTILDS